MPLAKLYKLHLNATLAESLLSSARATLSQAVERVPVDFSSLRTTFADSLASLQESQNPAAKAIGRFTSDPRLHELSSKALALADTYSPHLVGLVAVLFAVFLSSRSQRRDQSLYEEQLRQFDARMNDYGLGTSGANANGTMPAGGDRKDRAADDHGEVEVQWGREKLRIPLPQPSAPLSQFRTTLSNMTGVPPSHQKLIYAGAVLKDDNLPMSAYGLVEEDPSAVNASEPQKGRSFWDSWSLMGRKSTANKKGLKKLVMLGSATVSGHVNDHLSSRKDLQDLAAASPSGSVATAPGGADASASVAEAKVDSEETVQSRIRQIAVHKLDELEPQVKQVEAWLAQEQARRAAAGPDAQNDADAPPPPKRMLLYLSENLLQGLLKLDSTEIPSGYTEARKERKEAVRRVQEVLDRVDAAKEGWKKLGLSLT